MVLNFNFLTKLCMINFSENHLQSYVSHVVDDIKENNGLKTFEKIATFTKPKKYMFLFYLLTIE